MRYQRVAWHHEFVDEPTILYSEIDDVGNEVRKVDEYQDGALGFADKTHETDTTRLSKTVMPSLEEIARQEDFSPEPIGADAFNEIWTRATSGGA